MTGTVTISVEVELGWSNHDLGEYGHLSSDGNAEFDALTALLDICDERQIPISFDVVGHLLHAECDGAHEGPYPDGWWDADPGTNHRHDPLFYAPRFVEAIRDAQVDHEICTHTYSHVLCEQISDDVLDHELSTVADVHSGAGLKKPTSIVTPRHQQASTAVLRRHGIETVRSAPQDPQNWNDTLGKAGTFAWHLFGRHPVTELERSDSLVRTYCTPTPSLTSPILPSGQSPPHPAFRAIPRSIRRSLHRRFLRSAVDRAASADGHVHLWTHTYNMANKEQISVVRAGLEHLANRRDDGAVDIHRMCDLPGVLTGV